MKYDLHDSNAVRIEYCQMQKTTQDVRECNEALKSHLKVSNADGILVTLAIVGVFIVGFCFGKLSE